MHHINALKLSSKVKTLETRCYNGRNNSNITLCFEIIKSLAGGSLTVVWWKVKRRGGGRG